MERRPVLTEDHVLDYLQKNDLALSVEVLLERIVMGEGWKSSPDPDDLERILTKLSTGSSPVVKRVGEGNSSRYSLMRNVDRGFTDERDLDNPLVEWLRDSLDVQATPLPSGTRSGGTERGSQKWRYPDIVGFKRHSSSPGLNQFYKKTSTPSLEIFSFEIKKEIDKSNIREYFFQTLANSSWANQRYLVAAHITDGAMTEFRKLSRTYGMGLIRIVPGRDGTKIVPMKESSILAESPYHQLDVQTIRDFYETLKWKPFCDWLDKIGE